MPRRYQSSSSNKAATFFFATLLLWLVSVLFEIVFNKRRELLFIVVGGCFYQIANWVIRLCVSPDPLFVNTSVSLLHSAITSTSGFHHSLSFSSSLTFALLFLTRINYGVSSFLISKQEEKRDLFFWIRLYIVKST